jgi:predicted RND superfamily exporter protein
LFQFCYDRARSVLLVVFAFSCLAWLQLGSLQVRVSTDELIPASSPLKAAYLQHLERFGSDQVQMVYVTGDKLFTPQKLSALYALQQRLSALPEVERVESLFTVSNISGGGGWVDTSAVMSRVPSTLAEAERARQRALNNPLLVGHVINADGTAVALNCYLRAGSDGNELEPRQVHQAISAALEPARGAFEVLFPMGSATVQSWMQDDILKDQLRLLPLAFTLILVLIGFLLRSAQGAILVCLNAAVATLWTGGLMAWLGIPLNLLNAIVPALILVIGATEDVHILSEVRGARAAGASARQALLETSRLIGFTLLLTSLTTLLGFAVTGFSELPILRAFAASASLGMATRLLLSGMLIPAWLAVFSPSLKRPRRSLFSAERTFQEASVQSRFIMQRFVGHPIITIAVFVLLAVPCLYWGIAINVSNDLNKFLKEGSPTLEKLKTVEADFGGTKFLNVTLLGSPGEFRKADALQQLDAVTRDLQADPRVASAQSFADQLGLVHKAMFGAPQATMPQTEGLVAQYLMFFHPSQLEPYLTGNFSAATVRVKLAPGDSQAINVLASELRQRLARELPAHMAYEVSGKSLMVAAAVEDIIRAQVVSLGSMCVLLFVVIAVMFLSLRAGTMAVLANLFPVCVLFGVMGLLQVPLNVGTCMIAAVTLGIAVDDTLHLMSRYNKALKATVNEHKAMEIALVAEFHPVLVTSVSLASGFLVLGMSSFVPVQQFGLLSALVMALALLADLVLTPVLLSTVRLVTLWDVLGLSLRKRLMQGSEIFRGLRSWQVKRLILLSSLEDYPAGSKVVHQGRTGNRMYVLIDGQMQVRQHSGAGTTHLATLMPGDVFGEIALVANIERTADVVCEADCRLLALSWESLERLQRSSPYLSSRLFMNLSRILGLRLNEANRQKLDP